MAFRQYDNRKEGFTVRPTISHRVGALSILVILAFVVLLVGVGCQPAAGPAGPQGPAGSQGPAGPAGAAGPAGRDATLNVTQTTALQYAAVLSTSLAYPVQDQQRRGCTSCHVLADKQTGKYTLSYEAHERVEAQGRKHPDKAPDGTSLAPTSDVNMKVCLQCHASGTGAREDKGNIAPLSLRDIVHPAHMGSPTFKLHYGGQCFTCHNIDADGNFNVLTEKVDVNGKGVPNPAKLPIPGSYAP